MSGIFGAYSVKNHPVLEEVYLGLYALQHRGQESAGIAWAHGRPRRLGARLRASPQRNRPAQALARERELRDRPRPLRPARELAASTTSCPSARTTRAAPIAIAHDGPRHERRLAQIAARGARSDIPVGYELGGHPAHGRAEVAHGAGRRDSRRAKKARRLIRDSGAP